ncbi:MAG: recombinase family protein [Ktedonobacteraceae bacterium]|nr:recombinase family protein [Ktedonobacteraceae bacterium]
MKSLTIHSKRRIHKMKKFCVYARTAVSQEPGTNFAMVEQVHQCKEHGINLGYEFSNLVYEEVISGLSTTRPAIEKALQDAKKGKFDILVIRDYNRLARRGDLVLEFVALFEEVGVQVVSVVEQGENDPITFFVEAAKKFVADEERRRIAIRTRAGRQAKRERLV